MKNEANPIMSTTTAEEARMALRALALIEIPETGAHVHLECEGDPGEVEVTLPRQAIELLKDALEQLASGNAVTIVTVHAELTTHQAAEILNVSRPYLIKLLEAGHIPHRMVGTHRRIRLADIMEYKHKDDARRDEILAELTRQAQDLDLGY
jgi:excisionase family DNA binding protein